MRHPTVWTWGAKREQILWGGVFKLFRKHSDWFFQYNLSTISKKIINIKNFINDEFNEIEIWSFYCFLSFSHWRILIYSNHKNFWTFINDLQLITNYVYFQHIQLWIADWETLLWRDQNHMKGPCGTDQWPSILHTYCSRRADPLIPQTSANLYRENFISIYGLFCVLIRWIIGRFWMHLVVEAMTMTMMMVVVLVSWKNLTMQIGSPLLLRNPIRWWSIRIMSSGWTPYVLM